MASWRELSEAEPEFAARVLERLDSNVHKTIATLRRDGSPRISGIETQLHDGELYVGSMWRAVKALDLVRDGRYALHSGSEGGEGWTGDAKIAGVATEVTAADELARISGVEPGKAHAFRLAIAEATWVGLDEGRTKLVVETWHEGRGLERIER